MLRFRKFVSRGRALGRELVRGGSLGVYLGGDLVVDMAPVLAVAGRLGTMAPRSTISAKALRRSRPSQSRGSASTVICTPRRGTSRARWQPHVTSSSTRPPRRPSPRRRRELSFSVFRKLTPWRRMRAGSRPWQPRPRPKSVTFAARDAPCCTKPHACPQLARSLQHLSNIIVAARKRS